MTDHPKPIARYDIDRFVKKPTMSVFCDGDYVLYTDHEAALAAERERWREEIGKLAEKAKIVGMAAWAAVDAGCHLGATQWREGLEEVQTEAHKLEDELRKLVEGKQ